MTVSLAKKLRLIAIVAISVIGFALKAQAGENNLTISATTILPGETAVIAVNLLNADNCYGLQFDIAMPEGLSLIGVSKTDRTAGCILTPNLNDGKERVVLLSLTNPLPGAQGDVCQLSVQATSAFRGGTLKLTNARMSDGGNSDIIIPSTQCDILNVKNVSVAIPDLSITAGENKTVGVDIKAEGNVAGLQMDVFLPEELTIDLPSIALSNSLSGFILDKKQGVGFIRVLIYSLSNSVIPGDLNDVFSFTVKAAESASGSSDIKLQNISISTQTGVSIPLDNTLTKVTINKPLASSITLSPESAILKVGEQQQLISTVLPENAANKEVAWSVDNPTVATVDANGLVQAVGLGAATIMATSKDNAELKATCLITVVATPAASISLNKTEATLKATETVDLVATILPETTTDKAVTWTSSDEAIATVDANGKVTAVAVGKATVTATAASGVSAECAVTVVETPAGEIVIDKDALGITGDNIEMRVGDVKSIKVTVKPETTTDKSVTYESSAPGVASVDENGKVTALSLGTTSITITAKSGVSTSINVTVVATPAASISLNKTEVTLKATETVDLVATILPETTTDKSVTWKSSDAAVATVDANGKVTAVAVGKATITATAASGVSATCDVTVIETPAGGITLNHEIATLKVNDVIELVATVMPESTTDKSVAWKSSDEAIATVDANGKVTAVSVGNATITATATSGVSATCEVTVIGIPVESILLSSEDATIRVNQTMQLTAIILPNQATDKTIVWQSADEAIATVDATGLVRGKSVGVVTITATAASGVAASCAVTVLPRETAPITVTRSKELMVIMDGETAEMSVNVSGGYPEGLTFTWSNAGNTVGDTNALKVIGRCIGNKKSNEYYTVRIVDVCDGVTIFDESYTFEVETWPRPASEVTVETGSATDNLKIREGNRLELSTDSPVGGYGDNWNYDWYLDGTHISSEPEMSHVMTMASGTEIATSEAIVTLRATNFGPDGMVWGEAVSEPVSITVYRRPLTPDRLLRKGDGTTHTLIAMVQYSDEELARLGYTFVYGYTDATGDDHTVATTGKRYCRIDGQAFDNIGYDKWCYCLWTYADGSVVSSGKRYLDGRADEDFDASDFSGNTGPDKSCDFTDSGNWIRSSGNGINISIETASETRVDIFAVSGALVDTFVIPADTFMSVDYAADRLTSDFYIVRIVSAEQSLTRKIIIK